MTLTITLTKDMPIEELDEFYKRERHWIKDARLEQKGRRRD